MLSESDATRMSESVQNLNEVQSSTDNDSRTPGSQRVAKNNRMARDTDEEERITPVKMNLRGASRAQRVATQSEFEVSANGIGKCSKLSNEDLSEKGKFMEEIQASSKNQGEREKRRLELEEQKAKQSLMLETLKVFKQIVKSTTLPRIRS